MFPFGKILGCEEKFNQSNADISKMKRNRHYKRITISYELSFVFQAQKKKMIVTALNHLRTQIPFRVLSLFVESTWVCPWSRVLHQRIICLICVSHWKLKEYHFCLRKTEIGIVWCIPVSPVHFNTGDQTRIVLGQVRSRYDRTSNPRLFSYNLVGLWLWENLLLKKKKKMIRCREPYTVFSDDTPKMDS